MPLAATLGRLDDASSLAHAYEADYLLQLPLPAEPDLAPTSDDLGRVVRFVAESPAHVCVNEIVVTPTWNRLILGGGEMLLAPKID